MGRNPVLLDYFLILRNIINQTDVSKLYQINKQHVTNNELILHLKAHNISFYPMKNLQNKKKKC